VIDDAADAPVKPPAYARRAALDYLRALLWVVPVPC
jgi:hypothetical protein